MAGPDPRAPQALGDPGVDVRAAAGRHRWPACGSRCRTDLGGAFEVDHEVAAVVDGVGRGLRRRRRHGRAAPTPTSPRPTTPSAPCAPGTSRPASAALLAEHPDAFKQSLADNIRPASTLTGADVARAYAQRTALSERMRRVLRRRTTCWCCRSRRCRRSRPTRSSRPRSTAGRWRPTSTGCGRRTSSPSPAAPRSRCPPATPPTACRSASRSSRRTARDRCLLEVAAAFEAASPGSRARRRAIAAGTGPRGLTVVRSPRPAARPAGRLALCRQLGESLARPPSCCRAGRQLPDGLLLEDGTGPRRYRQLDRPWAAAVIRRHRASVAPGRAVAERGLRARQSAARECLDAARVLRHDAAPARGRDSSETRVHTTRTSLLGDGRGGWVTRPLGPETTSVSTGSVTGTGQLKGPCDSYSQGPFAHFRAGRSERWPAPRPPDRQSRSTVGIWAFSVDEPGSLLWTNRPISVEPEECFAKALAHPVRRGHRTSLTPSGNGRRDSSETRVHTMNEPACWGADRGGEMTTTPGPESTSSRSGASSVPVTPKGPWDSYSRGPFTYFPGAASRASRRP